MSKAVVEQIYIFSSAVIGLASCYSLTDENNEDNSDFSVANVGQILFRHKRSGNNTSSSSEDNRSAIEKFYDDPNNKAMYLVFPLFVLVIGTCCGLYFCDRCRKHFKKKKAEERKKGISGMTESEIRDPSPSSSNGVKQRTESLLNVEETALTESSNRNDTPLEDVENCPEVKAVNAVPIKHRETSFMSDVQNVNKTSVHTPPDSKAEIKPTVEANIITTTSLNNETKKAETTSLPEPAQNKEQHKDSRPSSKQSSKSSKSTAQYVAPIPDSNAIVHGNNDQKLDRKLTRENTKIEIEKQIQNNYENIKAKRRDSYRSVQSSKRSITPESKYSGSYAYHDKTTPLPDVTNSQKYQKMDKKFSHLSPEAIGEILQYYKDKKHMPDIIPDEDENIAPIKRKFRKAKYKIMNG